MSDPHTIFLTHPDKMKRQLSHCMVATVIHVLMDSNFVRGRICGHQRRNRRFVDSHTHRHRPMMGNTPAASPIPETGSISTFALPSKETRQSFHTPHLRRCPSSWNPRSQSQLYELTPPVRSAFAHTAIVKISALMDGEILNGFAMCFKCGLVFARRMFAMCFKCGLVFARRITCITGMDSFLFVVIFELLHVLPTIPGLVLRLVGLVSHLGNSLLLAPSDQISD